MVMGIALASNVGGMTSPISSPQNIFAIERMSMDGTPPSWLSWFAVSLPVSIVCECSRGRRGTWREAEGGLVRGRWHAPGSQFLASRCLMAEALPLQC